MLNGRFNAYVERMPLLFKQLMECDPVDLKSQKNWNRLKAVYAMFEGDVACHVGRTRDLASRMSGHRANSHYSASFAFAQTRLLLNLAPTYRKGEGRAVLLEMPGFRSEFDRQRERIGRMQLRYVEIVDPVEQHLFELYAALELGTPLKEFETS